LALFRAYANDPNLGPEGFVPAMAAIAASGLLSDARAPRTAAGRLRRVDLFTGANPRPPSSAFTNATLWPVEKRPGERLCASSCRRAAGTSQ
jgi:hypothetical protein